MTTPVIGEIFESSLKGTAYEVRKILDQMVILLNFWINEHDAGHPAGCSPILILDVFEHAFMIDYGLKKADYIEAFFKNINWKNAEGRLR